MTTVIAALVVANLFAFKGGSPLELLADVGSARESVVVMLFPSNSIPKLSFRWQSEADFNRLLALRSGLKCPKEHTAYFPPGWPRYMMSGKGRGDFERLFPDSSRFAKWKSDPDTGALMARGGDVSLLRLADLGNANIRPPIRVHPFYRSCVVAMTCGASKRVPLEYLAEACGARIVRTAAEIVLEPRESEVRARFVRFLEDQTRDLIARRSPTIEICDSELASAAVALASDAQIRKSLIEGDGTLAVSVLDGSPLSEQVANRLELYASRTDIRTVEEQYTPRQLVGMIDPNRPLSVVLNLYSATVSVRGFIKGKSAAGIEF